MIAGVALKELTTPPDAAGIPRKFSLLRNTRHNEIPPLMKKIEETIAEQIAVMFQCLEKRANPLFAPSTFWKELCDKHAALLRQHGFGRFKRTVNFWYGQWPICSLSDWQTKHLLKQLLKSGQLPYVPLLARIRDAEDVAWPANASSAATAYKVFVGLLWQLALSKDRLGCLKSCEEASVGGPINITYRNRLISQDMAQSSLELNSIMNHVGAGRCKKIGEVGGGSGRFAYLFMRTFPNSQYSIFDIPPALAISQNHLAAALGEGKVAIFDAQAGQDFVVDRPASGRLSAYLPYSLQSVPDGYFDLFLNVSSFDEMLPEQVDCYFDLIDRKCSGWLYLKGYTSRTGADLTRPWGLAQFPYRPNWKLVYEAKDPIMPSFSERIYDLRRS